jgi:hypothetical protein
VLAEDVSALRRKDTSMIISSRRIAAAPALLGIFAIASLVFAGASSVAGPANAADADDRPGCSHHLAGRSAEETVREHVALLVAGNLDQAMCDYAENARVILPGQVIRGLADIKGALTSVGSLLGGAPPQIETLTTAESVVLLTFEADGNPCTIPDGADTYVIDKGHIVLQTVHDTLHDAPGASCPAASL